MLVRNCPRSRSAAVAIGLLTLVPALAADHTLGLPPTKVDRIRRAVEAEMAAQHIPGLAVAVANDLRLLWSEGFGIADLEQSIPVTGRTMFRIASLSKPITATAVMQLVEAGKLELDAPIRKYVPSFPEKPWPVTVRSLLNHTSGIRHYASEAEVNSTRHYDDLLEPLKQFDESPLLFEPGTKFSYSTYGYSLLGAAVESAAGRPFLAYLQDRIFEPAKMDHTVQDDVYAIVPHRARGYRLAPSGALRNCALTDTSNKIPGGGLLSTPSDLVRFTIALERGILVKRATLDQMFTPGHTSGGAPTPYGLGWAVPPRPGSKMVFHTGAQQGVSTMLLSAPSQGFAVAVAANLEGANLGPLCNRIADIVLR